MPKPPLLSDSTSLFDRLADGITLASRRWGRQGWWIFLLIFTLIIVTSLPSQGQSDRFSPNAKPITQSTAKPATEPTTEIRGVWLTNIDSEVLFRTDRVAEAVNTLSRLNFNTLYPTVWNWGYTLYPSSVAQKAIGQSMDPNQGLKGRDILKEVTELGHKKGMTVIPWFEFGFMAPADSKLALNYPQWLTQRHDKSTVWLEGNLHQRVWLNPLNLEVQQLITHLVLEIVQNYGVDGIQFDDHFGYPADFGYDPDTVKLYRQEHKGKLPPTNPQDKEWVRWRADKITAFMKQLTVAIKQVRPQAIISLSPNPQDFSLNSFLLDWKQWEEQGLIDELVLQVYRFDLKAYRREISDISVQAAQNKIPFAVGILSGLKGRPVPIQQIQEQVSEARRQNLKGVSFFFYESLWNLGKESAQDRQIAFQNLFAQPVPRPIRPS
jgi:uncharacterized lipoprotein YddW (UPF0748 family)